MKISEINYRDKGNKKMTILNKEEIFPLIKNDMNNGKELTAEQLESFTIGLDAPILRMVIMHPNTSSETLLKLAKSPEVPNHLKGRLPFNDNTPQEALQVLMEAGINSKLAVHRLCTPEMMVELSTHEAIVVRAAVARNENTPKSILSKLSTDDSWVVREAVTSNPNTYQKDLDEVFKQANSIVNGKHKVPMEYKQVREAREVLETLAMREQNSEQMMKRLRKIFG